MSQLNFYKYASLGLLCLNIAMLAFFLFTKPPIPNHTSPKDFQAVVIEKLNLNDQQASTFRVLAQAHNEAMKSIEKEQRELLLPYFEGLIEPTENTEKEKLLLRVQALERSKMEVTYQHFEEIKKLLNKGQIADFEGFMKDFIVQILLNNKKSLPRPKENN